MSERRIDVHTRHCCKWHGCKYGDGDCTVIVQPKSQEGPCEECGLELEGYYGQTAQSKARKRWPKDWRSAR